jgi:hypothetical protein
MQTVRGGAERSRDMHLLLSLCFLGSRMLRSAPGPSHLGTWDTTPSRYGASYFHGVLIRNFRIGDQAGGTDIRTRTLSLPWPV